jgi:hypothetical protein
MSTRISYSILLLALSTSAACASDDADLAARLERMEARWERIEAEIAALRDEIHAARTPAPVGVDTRVAAVESAIDGVREDLKNVGADVSMQRELIDARSEADSRAPTLSSYGTLAYVDHDDRRSAFDASSFELLVSGQPSSRVSFFSELEFERAATVGGSRGGEVLLEQAYVDLGMTEHLSLRAGVLLMPFGNKNVDHFSPIREVVSQPLSAYAIAPSDWADNGLGVTGDRPVGEHWTMDYAAYVVNGLGSALGDYGYRGGPQPFGVDNNDSKAMAGRVAFTHAGGSVLGLSAYQGAYDDRGDLGLLGLGIDGIFELGRLRWTGELLHATAERRDGSYAESTGGYLRTIWRLDAGWASSLIDDVAAEPSLSLVHEYDYVRLEPLLQPLAPVRREWRHVFGVLLSLQHNWIFKLNREYSGYAGAPVLNGDAKAWQASVGYVF